MFLSEVIPGRELNGQGVAIARAIPDAIARHMRGETVVCEGCRQGISAGIHVRLIRGRAHHPSCAERAQRRTVTPSADPDRIIALIAGIALTFDRGGCGVADPDGTWQNERFTPDCFDASLAEGGQMLLTNHTSAPLRGRYLRLLNDGGRLVFRFALADGVFERSTLQKIRAGQIRHCSIGFVPDSGATRSRGMAGIEYGRARLMEISLCDGRRPAWHSTSVWCE